jgi:hypothetical protein
MRVECRERGGAMDTNSEGRSVCLFSRAVPAWERLGCSAGRAEELLVMLGLTLMLVLMLYV